MLKTLNRVRLLLCKLESLALRFQNQFTVYSPNKYRKRNKERISISVKGPHVSRKIYLISRAVTTIVGSLLIVSCSSPFRTSAGLIDRLKNRGPVALSPDNPYIAPNLLISKEMERSPELSGFIQHRGGPSALEVRSGSFTALKLILSYLDNKEFYTLEEVDDTWVIKGPDPMTDEAVTFLKKSISSAKNEVLAGKLPKNISIIPTETPTPKPKENGSAEITPKGDLVHYVTTDNETIEEISSWYTEDESNAKLLRKLNKLKENQSLSAGDVVVIPKYLVKKTIRFSSHSSE